MGHVSSVFINMSTRLSGALLAWLLAVGSGALLLSSVQGLGGPGSVEEQVVKDPFAQKDRREQMRRSAKIRMTSKKLTSLLPQPQNARHSISGSCAILSTSLRACISVERKSRNVYFMEITRGA